MEEETYQLVGHNPGNFGYTLCDFEYQHHVFSYLDHFVLDPSQIVTSEVLHEVLGKCSAAKIDPSPKTRALAMLSLRNLIETLAKVDPPTWGDLFKPYQGFVKIVLSKKDLFQKGLSSSRKDNMSSFKHGAHLWAKIDQSAKEKKCLTKRLHQLVEKKHDPSG